jgi:hypothetical protein
MSDLNPLALARDLCSRATPYRLLKRVAGLAFNFSSVNVAVVTETVEEVVAETKRPSGIRPAFRGV